MSSKRDNRVRCARMTKHFDGVEGFNLSQSETAREIATELLVSKWCAGWWWGGTSLMSFVSVCPLPQTVRCLAGPSLPAREHDRHRCPVPREHAFTVEIVVARYFDNILVDIR